MSSVSESKTCFACKETLPLQAFNKNRNSPDGYYTYCRVCTSVKTKELRVAAKNEDPERLRTIRRRSMLWTNYRITPNRYQELLQAQGGLCAICTRAPEAEENFIVDHDHSCCPGVRSCGRCIRGILCRLCNVVLGQAGDSPETLEKAARYLRTASSSLDA